MSYTQFGYSTYAASAPLVIGGSTSQNTCYERTGVSPESQYDARLYPRLSTYTAPYQPESNLDPAATPFYAPTLNSTYGMKESPDPWRSISQSASYYYDPTLAAYGYGGLDFNGARRKNVTRDSTSTLKAWLNEHRKNPYPTKGEKIMLAIITKMTLTQVSTWFANARRRLKKENKMTWEPRNKAEAHEEDGKREDEKDDEEDPPSAAFREEEKPLRTIHSTEMELGSHHQRSDAPFRPSVDHHPHHQPPPPLQGFDDSHQPDILSAASLEAPPSTNYSSSQSSSPDLGVIDSYMHHQRPSKSDPFDPYKPKIWSLADTATNKALLPPYAPDLCPQTAGWAAQGPPFGRYSCNLHGFGPISLQTDTPPQTPPNMKVTAHASTVPSSAYIETHRSSAHAYMGGPGQSALCQSEAAMAEAQLQDDKMESFSTNHGSQSSTSNQNTASDCISEDYDYSTSSVR